MPRPFARQVRSYAAGDGDGPFLKRMRRSLYDFHSGSSKRALPFGGNVGRSSGKSTRSLDGYTGRHCLGGARPGH